MQANLSEALSQTATPKGVIQKRATKLTLIYVKSPRLKKQCHILSYSVLRIRNDQCKHFKFGFTEYGLTNSSVLSLALPLTATQKVVIKWGNKLDMYLCKKKSNANTSVISYLRVPEYGMTNGSNIRVAFTLDSTPKRGNKIYI